jgi:hypothetical protein
MKFWSIITLMIVLNFTALPSIAAIADWKIMRTNVIVNEEETHSHYSSLFSVYEKTLPKTLDVYDYLKFFEPDLEGSAFLWVDDTFHHPPFLTIFSPPPEKFI